jgi:hypothetical protein
MSGLLPALMDRKTTCYGLYFILWYLRKYLKPTPNLPLFLQANLSYLLTFAIVSSLPCVDAALKRDSKYKMSETWFLEVGPISFLKPG